jgi:hypothetical protein
MAIRLAQAFVIASLILLLVYGADAGSSSANLFLAVTEEKRADKD